MPLSILVSQTQFENFGQSRLSVGAFTQFWQPGTSGPFFPRIQTWLCWFHQLVARKKSNKTRTKQTEMKNIFLVHSKSRRNLQRSFSRSKQRFYPQNLPFEQNPLIRKQHQLKFTGGLPHKRDLCLISTALRICCELGWSIVGLSGTNLC